MAGKSRAHAEINSAAEEPPAKKMRILRAEDAAFVPQNPSFIQVDLSSAHSTAKPLA